MRLLWGMGEATTPELHKAIQDNRVVAYSTVRTIVDRLEQKGAIERQKTGRRALTYRPKLKEARVSRSLVQKFVRTAFDGESRALFSHLLADESLDEDDIEYLESLIADKKRDLGGRD